MTLVTVTPQDVLQASIDCMTTAGHVQTELFRLGQYVEGVRVTYLGMASLAFNTLMANYHAHANNLVNALVDISELLKRFYLNYTGTEEQNLKNLLAVDAGLPANPAPVANL